MTYSVTYRGADGALHTEVVDAASRSACIAMLKARGIVPMRIEEGKGTVRPPRRIRGGKASNSRLAVGKALLACGLAAAIGACGWLWWVHGRGNASRLPTSAPQHTSVGRVAPTQPRVVEEPKQPTKPAEAQTESAPDEWAERFPGEKILSVTTNGSGYITVKAIGTDGRRKRHVVSPPPVFECPSDELIMVALTTPEGRELPPLPDLGGARADAEFLKSLEKPIPDKPGDSPEVKAQKEIVRAARDEIRARMEAGEHFADILADHVKLRNENGEIRARAQSELNRLVREGDMEGARHYREVMNTALSQMGISGVEMPGDPGSALMRLREAAKKRRGEKR